MLELTITLESVEKKIIMRLSGRLDAVSVPVLEKKIDTLIQDKHYELLLDFSNVDYLSSAGLRLLFAESKKIKSKGGHLVIFSLEDDIKEIIHMSGFDRVLSLCNTEKQALQYLGK